jgi:hypothetical protein
MSLFVAASKRRLIGTRRMLASTSLPTLKEEVRPLVWKIGAKRSAAKPGRGLHNYRILTIVTSRLHLMVAVSGTDFS